jgi:hypothetical protein
MLATATRAPRLRLHRETVRNLAVSRDAAGLPVTLDPACNTSECDITLTCTQFNCAPTHPDFCISL